MQTYRDYAGNYYGVAPFLVSPLEGLRESNAFSEVKYAKGCDVNSSVHRVSKQRRHWQQVMLSC